MGTKNDTKSRRQKNGTYYSFSFFVYGVWDHFWYPQVGPLNERGMWLYSDALSA